MVKSYSSILTFEIIVSHLFLLLLFIILKNYLNPYNNLLIFMAVLLNPFLVLYTRNPGVTAHFELFAVLFLYFYLNRNEKK
jgi:hypothetical protein